jgi:sigma-B regulation protein RsbU (phosphoserine phosphatase)
MSDQTDTVKEAVPAAVFDARRLAAVKASDLVDSPPDEAFDRLAALAARLLDAPLAFITAVDATRSWYKSFIGGEPGAQRWGAVEESFCQYVVGSGSECIIGDACQDPLTKRNPAIENMGVVAWAGFPLHAPGGEVLGTLCVVDTKPRTWTDRDVQVLETLAAAASAEVALRASLGEERTQRERAMAAADALERANVELEETATHATALASTLSDTLLPRRLSPVDGLDVATRYRAAQAQMVTGDFYDLFPLGGDAWAVVIGDVVGKGPSAAAYTAEVRYTVRAEAVRRGGPAEVLQAVNRTLRTYAERSEQFVTVAYCSLRRSSQGWDVAVALAGHPHPLLRRADGVVEQVGVPGVPLGLFDDAHVGDHRVALSPGEALVLYTDGVVEARRGAEEYGLSRLVELVAASEVASADALAEEIMDAVAAFTTGGARDDTAVMVLLGR